MYGYLPKWEADGTWQRASTCWNVSSRERAEKAWPTVVTLDSQSIKNAAMTIGATVESNAGKLVKGCKRLVLTDTLRNVLYSSVLPANAAAGPGAIAFWDEVAASHDLPGRVQVVFVDSSFNGVFRQHLAQRYGIRVEKPVHVLVKETNFCIHAWRWIVERTFAWFGANHRLSKEYD